jgi:hypothetical protein
MTTVVLPVLRPDDAVRVVAAPGDGVGFWAGAPSAVRVDGVWWLAYRVRVADDAGRGLAVRLARSHDGLVFETVGEIGREPFGAASLERPALVPLPGGGWRLLLSCAAPGSAHWWIDSLEADDVAGLAAGRRRPVLSGDATTGVKDPVVRIGPDGWRMWACCHPLDDPAHTDRMTTRLYTSLDGWAWDAGRTVLAPCEARRPRARRPAGVPCGPRTHGGRLDAPAAVGAHLLPGSWDRRGTRLTAVLSGGPREPTLALYDGRGSAEENWFERTGVALLTREGRFVPTRNGPMGESPYGGGTLRYVSAVPLGDWRYRLYYEAARPDGAHDLYTQEINLVVQPAR